MARVLPGLPWNAAVCAKAMTDAEGAEKAKCKSEGNCDRMSFDTVVRKVREQPGSG